VIVSMVSPSATVRLSELRDEMYELADRDPLTDAEEARWHQLVPHWLALTNRILEDRN
jgi:hypothetical protein